MTAQALATSHFAKCQFKSFPDAETFDLNYTPMLILLILFYANLIWYQIHCAIKSLQVLLHGRRFMLHLTSIYHLRDIAAILEVESTWGIQVWSFEPLDIRVLLHIALGEEGPAGVGDIVVSSDDGMLDSHTPL